MQEIVVAVNHTVQHDYYPYIVFSFQVNVYVLVIVFTNWEKQAVKVCMYV